MAAKKKKKDDGNAFRLSLMGVFSLITALVFMPTTVMLAIAMLPTVAAGLSDMKTGKTRALTIGAMNLAGALPFMLRLWSEGHNVANALVIVIDPWTIVVIYSAAGIGWIIDWAMSGIVATLMQQKGASRLKDIAARQEALIKRWGREVTGDLPLDAYGFPVQVEGAAASDDDSGSDTDSSGGDAAPS